MREGVKSSEVQRSKELEREVKELRRAKRHTEAGQRVCRSDVARPPAEVLKTFIDKHRDAFGVVPLCQVLQVAPLAYRRHAALLRERPQALSSSMRTDFVLDALEQNVTRNSGACVFVTGFPVIQGSRNVPGASGYASPLARVHSGFGRDSGYKGGEGSFARNEEALESELATTLARRAMSLWRS